MTDPDFVPVFGPTRCAHLDKVGELVWTEGQMYIHRSVVESFTDHMQGLYPVVGTLPFADGYLITGPSDQPVVTLDLGEPYETPDGP